MNLTGHLHIKVCGMKSPCNRESLETMAIDYFGFIFHPVSPRYVGNMDDPEQRRLFSTTKYRTGVFVGSQVGEVIRLAQKWHFTHVQLHGHESSENCREIRSSGILVIKSFPVHTRFDFNECAGYANDCDFFLFDAKGKLPGGTGEKFKWEVLNDYHLEVPFFLSGGITPGDESAILGLNHPFLYGIDLNSGFEDAPGVKNPEKIKLFLQNLNTWKGKDSLPPNREKK